NGSRPLTMADYASTSGITLRLAGDVWVNAPVREHNPNFVTSPRHTLEIGSNGFVVRGDDIEVVAVPIPVPAYHEESNARGELYSSYAITHSDRVRISPAEGCAITCQFCDLPYEFRYRTKPVEGLVDAVAHALADPVLPARHVLISGGLPREADYDWIREVWRAVPAAFPEVEVDVMMVPAPGLLVPADLHADGIAGLAINLEMWNQELARKIMPAKWRIGRDRWLSVIEDAVRVYGPGHVRSLLLVGIESIEDTLAGVDALAARGCEPVLSPFRPDPSTPMRAASPPTEAELGEVWERSEEIVRRHGGRLGPRCVPCMHNTLTFPEVA
ncbi:MAG TPA: radical SAM protein, partial [Thermoanaerobaculia bacterium]|nr:radical SAM protein [Thermoanaerobaculia bacterium]